MPDNLTETNQEMAATELDFDCIAGSPAGSLSYVLAHTLECQPGGPGLSTKADRCRQLARTVPVMVIAPSLLVLRCQCEISRQLDDYIADLQRAQKRI